MKETHRIATIFAGVYTLIQSVIWCLIAIYSVAIYACQAPFPFSTNRYKITIADLLYISYYWGKCRPTLDEPQVEAPSAVRTYYWMLVYGVFSAVWIPTSVLLLVASINRIRGHYGSCLYIPWIINTTIIILADLCATIVYGIDISHTLTVKDYTEFVKPVPVIAAGADGITVVPAIEMTVFFSRAIVFWLLNFILLGVVIQGCRALRSLSPTSAFVENEARMKPEDRSNTSKWVNVKSDEMSLKRLPRLQIEEDEIPPARTRSPLDSPIRVRAAYNPISPQSPISETSPIPIRPVDPPPPAPVPPPPLERESSVNSRGNSSPVYDVYGKHLGNALPEEIHKLPTNDAALKSGLSNQVPWSYAPTGELNLRLKQAAMHQRESDRPQIPQPDYTMHYPRNRNVRPELASNEGDWAEYNSNSTLYSGSLDRDQNMKPHSRYTNVRF